MKDYKDLAKLICKPWVDVEDIQSIAHCGKKRAYAIIKEIENNILESGSKLPLSKKKYIPTRLLLEYFGLDSNYILNVASEIDVGG